MSTALTPPQRTRSEKRDLPRRPRRHRRPVALEPDVRQGSWGGCCPHRNHSDTLVWVSGHDPAPETPWLSARPAPYHSFSHFALRGRAPIDDLDLAFDFVLKLVAMDFGIVTVTPRLNVAPITNTRKPSKPTPSARSAKPPAHQLAVPFAVSETLVIMADVTRRPCPAAGSSCRRSQKRRAITHPVLQPTLVSAVGREESLSLQVQRAVRA